MKLTLENLTVESFETGTELVPGDEVIATHPNDPTPATRCRWCPEATFTCP